MNVTDKTIDSITISWSAVSGADEYRVYRSSEADDIYTLVGAVSSPSTDGPPIPPAASYTQTGLSTNTTYYYKVSAYNSNAGESAQSSSVSATTQLNAPTGLNVTGKTSNSITISWTAVSGATEYYVYRSSSDDGTYTLVTTSTISDTSYTNTGLWSGTTYYYKVSAYNSSAGESSPSDYFSETTD